MSRTNNYTIKVDIQAVSNFGKITKNLNAQLTSMQKKVNGVTKSTKASSMAFSRLETNMTRLSFVAIPALGLAFKSIIGEGMRFETALADLSALTGISGEGLDSLAAKSDNLSTRFGLGADVILKGMKRIASNRSQLIGVEGAIEGVAESASILAKATGLSMNQASDVLTATMNQFALDSSEVDRVMNVFAMGAKLGAFEVDRAAQAFSRSGAAMKVAGLSFEEAMGAVQIGSQLNLTGEMVGTQLKTALLRLVARDNPFNPLLVGWDQAIENLGTANLTPAEMTAIFGMESFQVGNALIENIDLMRKWTKEVTGTQKAHEQAAINMKTFSFRLSEITQRLNQIKRDWFLDEKNYALLNKGVDRLEEFLNQSTPRARLLWIIMKDLAKLLSAAIILTAFTKIGRALKFIWTMSKGIKKLVVFQTMAKWLGKSAVGAKVLQAGFLRLLFLATALVAVVWNIGRAAIDAWGSFTTQWSAGNFAEAGKTMGKAFAFGFLQGLQWLGSKLIEPFAWLEDRVGKTVNGNDYTSMLRQWVEDSQLITEKALFTPEERSRLGLSKSELAKQDAFKASFLQNRATPEDRAGVASGKLKIIIETGEDGRMVPRIVNPANNVDVTTRLGNTSITPTYRAANPFAYGFAF